MNKTGNINKSGIWAGNKLLPIVLFVFVLIPVAASCQKEERDIDRAEVTVSSTGTTAVNTVSPENTAREAILLRGNSWISGIPGFGINSFSALMGEYGLGFSSSQTERGDVFTVYVTMEPLYFPENWQIRPNMGSSRVFQRSDGESYLVAAILEGSQGILWTVIFHFPNGIEETGLNTESFNSLFRVWTGRMAYFLYQSATPEGISLPGAVEFQ